MAQVVITVIGNDRAGLVERLSQAVTDTGGNWERSHLVEMAGKFAGVVLVTLSDAKVEALTGALDRIESEGLLDISVERARPEAGTGDGSPPDPRRLTLKAVGQDHEGIVHDISHVLAGLDVNIDEFETAVVPAPMGGTLFEANALLTVPAQLDAEAIETGLEAISPELMIDVDSYEPTGGAMG